MPGAINHEMGSLVIAGLGIVFSVLALIAAVVALLKRLDDRWQEHEARLAARATENEPTIDATTLVLITAACATVAGGRYRVRRIRRLLPMQTKRTPWSAQGRLILMGSHAVKRTPKYR